MKALARLAIQQPKPWLMFAVLGWIGLYYSLIPLSESIVSVLPVARDGRLGDALQFFFYDTPKVLLLLTGVVFVMGMINSYFTPERTREATADRHLCRRGVLRHSESRPLQDLV